MRRESFNEKDLEHLILEADHRMYWDKLSRRESKLRVRVGA